MISKMGKNWRMCSALCILKDSEFFNEHFPFKIHLYIRDLKPRNYRHKLVMSTQYEGKLKFGHTPEIHKPSGDGHAKKYKV